MKKRDSVIKHGLISLLVFAFFVFVLLFGNNAGWWRATEGPLMGVLLFFGWPFVLGSAIGGLMAWGGGSPAVAIVLAIAGLIINVLYAFGVGALVGYFLRKN